MAATAEELKMVMRGWASGVAVLTCTDGKICQGMTVSSFNSVSVDPPVVTVSLANHTRAKRIVEVTNYFAINILSSDEQELADRFAGRSGDQEDRFKGVKVTRGLHEIPLLEVASAWLVCKVLQTIPFPESTLFVGEVLKCARGKDLDPLVYFDRDYHRLEK